jgi:enoyl-CoA hydratase/carnithine racemase
MSCPTDPPVLYEKSGHVARVTLNRPHVLNALDARTHQALSAVWDDFAADSQLRVAVLTGAGDRAFSVGRDLKEAGREQDEATNATTFGSRGGPGWPRLTERFDLFKPVVARVNGYALGGGLELALACDVIVAAEHAELGLPEVKLGLVAGAGGVFRLTRQVPFKPAMGMLLTGRPVGARRAYQLGLVNDVVAQADLDGCVDHWVTDLVAASPLAVQATKEAALRSWDVPLEQAFTLRYDAELARMQSHDAREGTRAFLENRPPLWK